VKGRDLLLLGRAENAHPQVQVACHRFLCNTLMKGGKVSKAAILETKKNNNLLHHVLNGVTSPYESVVRSSLCTLCALCEDKMFQPWFVRIIASLGTALRRTLPATFHSLSDPTSGKVDMLHCPSHFTAPVVDMLKERDSIRIGAMHPARTAICELVCATLDSDCPLTEYPLII
jgi:hypothetical protein